MIRRVAGRFYRDATLASQSEGYAVLLDGRPARTLGGAQLCLPRKALAEAIAEEWRAQSERMDIAAMKLTGLAGRAIDLRPANRSALIEHVLDFGRSDPLCYRADAPLELAFAQGEVWDPLLDWVERNYGAKFATGAGIAFIVQPDEVLRNLRAAIGALDDFALVGLDAVASLLGSLIVALALFDGRLGAGEAFAAALLDELYQAEKWGRDAEAESRRAILLGEVTTLEHFARLLQAD